MNVFELRDQLVDDYRAYTCSFIKIRDPWIKEFVDMIERGVHRDPLHHSDDWEAIFRRHPDVFGAPSV